MREDFKRRLVEFAVWSHEAALARQDMVAALEAMIGSPLSDVPAPTWVDVAISDGHLAAWTERLASRIEGTPLAMYHKTT